MMTVKNENIRPFDVDGCLIVEAKDSRQIAHILDPVTKRFIKVGVNRAMVRLLKEEKKRGSYTIVWSRSGYEWANNVIQCLYLDDYVDLIMSKPIVYFDDTPVKKWLKDRVFIGPDVKYKE